MSGNWHFNLTSRRLATSRRIRRAAKISGALNGTASLAQGGPAKEDPRRRRVVRGARVKPDVARVI